jgi:hypothetical protein
MNLSNIKIRRVHHPKLYLIRDFSQLISKFIREDIEKFKRG